MPLRRGKQAPNELGHIPEVADRVDTPILLRPKTLERIAGPVTDQHQIKSPAQQRRQQQPRRSARKSSGDIQALVCSFTGFQFRSREVTRREIRISAAASAVSRTILSAAGQTPQLRASGAADIPPPTPSHSGAPLSPTIKP